MNLARQVTARRSLLFGRRDNEGRDKGCGCERDVNFERNYLDSFQILFTHSPTPTQRNPRSLAR